MSPSGTCDLTPTQSSAAARARSESPEKGDERKNRRGRNTDKEVDKTEAERECQRVGSVRERLAVDIVESPFEIVKSIRHTYTSETNFRDFTNRK